MLPFLIRKSILLLFLSLVIYACTNNDEPVPTSPTAGTPVLDCGPDDILYSTEVKPIIASNCLINNPNCHGMNSLIPDWSNFSNVKSRAISIRTRTTNRSMPPSGGLTDEEINLIACWVQQGAKDN